MKSNNKLTNKNFWVSDNFQNYVFTNHEDSHGISMFIKKYIPPNVNGNCLEIGSFPGPFLSVFGKLGYTLNGVDFHPLNALAVPNWLQSLGYSIGDFVMADFFEYTTQKKYDVVASFGFIEHFVDYIDVINRHAALVDNNGFICITTPNFKGKVQFWLHSFFDANNLAKHNINSMQPKKWANILQSQGFEIIYQGYFGDFWFWHGNESLPIWKKNILWVVERTVPLIRKLLWFQSSSFSAYAGIIAKKNN